MGNFEDLTERKFGRWTVLKRAPNRGTRTAWTCQCQCGVIKDVLSCHLKSGKSQSCGCLHNELLQQQRTKNLIGQRFGMLTVIAQDNTPSCRPRWICKCDCGNIKSIEGIHLTQGKITSCGCLNCSNGEYEIKQLLLTSNIDFIQEYTFPDLYRHPGYPLRFDFAVLNDKKELITLIEFNGIQHYQAIPGYSDIDNLLDLQERDQMKIEYCKQHNIPLKIIPYTKLGKITLNDLL